MLSIAVWQQALWQQFIEQRRAERLHHAYLLRGQSGIGKQQLAEQMALALICSNNSATELACMNCKNCRSFQQHAHPDVNLLGLDRDTNIIKIDDIRILKQKTSQQSVLAQYKVILIFSAERMNLAASNALLKLLEEPGTDTVFLLTSARRVYYQRLFSVDVHICLVQVRRLPRLRVI